MGITERVNKLIEHYGLNPNSFATKLGVSAATTHGIAHGRTKPSFDMLEKMAETFTDVNANWLLTGKGAMLKEDCVPASTHLEVVKENEKLKEKVLDFVMGKPSDARETAGNRVVSYARKYPFRVPQQRIINAVG